ncbi:g3090 [Coccomyxa viridis]|uniref:G3090 protein n=1 Tax=Coccomyxa viridis TaxID=1274662 RepID=A0ABP1FQZ0_9CHLO
MMHSGMHNAGVPVVADKTKCTKTPSDEREGEDAAIGEPAEALAVIKAPEALLSETGPGVVDEVRIETPADEREGEDPTIQVGEPAKETTVTKAPAEAPPTETGPGTADEVKSKTSPDEREGKEPAIAKPVESTPVTEAPIEAAPKETGMPSSGNESVSAETSSAAQSPDQDE